MSNNNPCTEYWHLGSVELFNLLLLEHFGFHYLLDKHPIPDLEDRIVHACVHVCDCMQEMLVFCYLAFYIMQSPSL